jgi:hypothetical protein
MLIDLRKLREPVTVWVRDSLITFSTEYPNTQVSTVGLWGDGFHGTAALHLDTPENSAEHVKEWLKDGPDWYGEDHKGRYCDSCWDFEHFIGDYSFPGYPDLYQTDVDAPVDYITLDGSKERAEADQGDPGHASHHLSVSQSGSLRSILCSAGADPYVPSLCPNERKTIRRVLEGGNLKARHKTRSAGRHIVMFGSGHSRPGRADSRSGHVRHAPIAIELCIAEYFRDVPKHKVASLQPAARGRRETGSQLRGKRWRV